jgi:hypothetical protein
MKFCSISRVALRNEVNMGLASCTQKHLSHPHSGPFAAALGEKREPENSTFS